MSNRNGTFKKGDSRINRAGRPKKGKTLTDVLTKYGNKRDVTIQIDGEDKMMSRKEALARIVWDMALKERNITAIKYIYDRIDGFPVQTEKIDANIQGGVTLEDLHKEAEEWEEEHKE